MNKSLLYLILYSVIIASCNSNDIISTEIGNDWPVYGGNKAGNRYSPLKQINLDNVNNLELAWTYRAAEENSTSQRGIQCQPIVVDGILYGIGLELKLFALNAGTGEELWEFDPQIKGKSRGLVYWENGDDKRILYSVGPNLYAVNADNGKKVLDFGHQGIVDQVQA